MWFNLVENESDIHYAIDQLNKDGDDLAALVGKDAVVTALADPARAAEIKREVLDILWSVDLLRDRARRAIGLACRFISTGPAFVSLKPIDALEKTYVTHAEWIEEARPVLEKLAAGSGTCFDLLHYGG